VKNVPGQDEKNNGAGNIRFNDIDNITHANVTPPSMKKPEARDCQQTYAHEQRSGDQQNTAVRKREVKTQKPSKQQRG